MRHLIELALAVIVAILLVISLPFLMINDAQAVIDWFSIWWNRMNWDSIWMILWIQFQDEFLWQKYQNIQHTYSTEQSIRDRLTVLLKFFGNFVHMTGLEPARSKANTSPSSWRVYQFHHMCLIAECKSKKKSISSMKFLLIFGAGSEQGQDSSGASNCCSERTSLLKLQWILLKFDGPWNLWADIWDQHFGSQ